MNGQIIAITGSSGCGKTYLSKKLAENCNGVHIPEIRREDLPQRIIKNLKGKKNFLETQVWFKYYSGRNYQKALKLKKAGKLVFLDAPFYQNQLFSRYYFKDDNFLSDTWTKLGLLDFDFLPQPDATIYIKATSEQLKSFINARRNRNEHYMWEDEEWVNFITDMIPYTDECFKIFSPRISDLIIINRSEWDFEKDDEIKKLVSKINKVLNFPINIKSRSVR